MNSQGRLFWSHTTARYDLLGNILNYDVAVSQIDPVTGAIVAGPHLATSVSPTSDIANDEASLVADCNPHNHYQCKEKQ